MNKSHDPVRYGTIALALERLRIEGIAGAFAEIGVFRGQLSEFIHASSPDSKLYLVDIFQGFPERDGDNSFRQTNVEFVKRGIAAVQPGNLISRIGEFPATAVGLEQERFSLVI